MWILRRLKSLGCSTPELLNVLREQIVSICEVGVPWWGPMITKHESNMLERVLKTGLYIIFQEKYENFRHSLKLANCLSLKQRRVIQITKFSKKSYNNSRFNTWFCKAAEQQEPPIKDMRPFSSQSHAGHSDMPGPVCQWWPGSSPGILPSFTPPSTWHEPPVKLLQLIIVLLASANLVLFLNSAGTRK